MAKIVEIRNVKYSDWAELYSEYANTFHVELTKERLQLIWQWLMGHETELRGIGVVSDEGKLVAIVHYRRFLRPLVGEVGIYLDDIYVSPDARRSGVGNLLFEALEKIADAQDCSVIRWITSDENKEAHKFYDRFGHKTRWITYDHLMGEDQLDIERK